MARGGWQSCREVGEEEEEPDEVRSDPRDVDGDFKLRWSSEDQLERNSTY